MQQHTENPEFKKYHATINFYVDDDFMALVPPHRTYINYLINKNIIDSYTVSLESYKSWIVFNAKSKTEVLELLSKSPLHKYWTIEVSELFVYDGQSYRLPTLQLN